MIEALKRLSDDDTGHGIVEYTLIVGLVAMVVLGALIATGDHLDGLFEIIE